MSTTLAELSELAESVSRRYAKRFGIERDAAWYLAKLTEEMGELQAAYLDHHGQSRRTLEPTLSQARLDDELADLLMTTLLFARWQAIDIDAAVERKWGQHRPQ
ncbi:MAG: MazG nucleotide pyrophosphohydrolase domain-containing protein [Pseudomonadota bacterium]